jgi:RNA polymerase sigma-70 factor (ECF subfamily)
MAGRVMTAVLEPARPADDDPRLAAWRLVERAQAGDTDAFGQLYTLYQPLIMRVIYRRVGHRQTAEDLTSDTFVRALVNIDRLTWQGRDVGAWLTSIARNLIADHFKSGRYRLEVATADLPNVSDRPDPHGGAEDQALAELDAAAARRLVEGLVAQLIPTHHECIQLRFLRGRTVAETAAAMGKNSDSIKELTYRAVRALGRLYAAEQEARRA